LKLDNKKVLTMLRHLHCLSFNCLFMAEWTILC